MGGGDDDEEKVTGMFPLSGGGEEGIAAPVGVVDGEMSSGEVGSCKEQEQVDVLHDEVLIESRSFGMGMQLMFALGTRYRWFGRRKEEKRFGSFGSASRFIHVTCWARADLPQWRSLLSWVFFVVGWICAQTCSIFLGIVVAIPI